MQSPDADPQHPPQSPLYTLWVDVVEDLPNINIEAILNEVATTLFNTLSSADTHGYRPTASIKIASNEDVRTLNRDFRNKDKPTNVLSFPSDPEDALIEDEPDEPPQYYLGDIIMAVGTLMKEAEEANKPLAHHLTHLAVHGLLHLIGFDHETDEDAALMEALEIKILKTLNINNPYETHAPSA